MNPPRGDAEARHAVILGAALRVFGQYGFRRTSMDDIAREAEIGKGTIYLSFASKDEVFQALAQRLAGQMLAGAEAASRQPATTADKLAAMHAAWFGTYAETIRRSPHAADLLDAKHQLSADLVSGAASRYKRLVRDVLRRRGTGPGAGRTHARYCGRVADRLRPRAGFQLVLARRLPAPPHHARPGHDRRAGQQAPRRSPLKEPALRNRSSSLPRPRITPHPQGACQLRPGPARNPRSRPLAGR
jgi:AcrR family transcriptional regulator